MVGEVAIPGVDSGPALLTLRVGDDVATFPVDLPRYSVQVPAGRHDAMVSIEIDSTHGRHAAILGSYGRMVRTAGADAVLTAGELDRVRVTAMGTALHFHVRRLLGNRLPASDQEHEQVIRSIGMEAAIGGNIVQAAASGKASVPAPFPHAYALLGDAGAVRGYLQANPAVAAGLEDFVQQATGIPASPALLGAETAMLPPVARGDATLLPAAARLVVRRGLDYDYHGRGNVDPVASVAALDAETLRVIPRSPGHAITYDFMQLAPGEPPVQVMTRQETVHETWRRQFAGDRYSLWSVTEVARRTYPDHPGIAPREVEATRIVHGFRLDRLTTPILPRDLLGRRALPWFCIAYDPLVMMDALQACEYAQASFSRDGTGLAQDIGAKVDAGMQPRTTGFDTMPFRWITGSRGALRLLSTGTQVKYWRLDGGDATMAPVLYLATMQAPDGRTHTLAGTSVLTDARGGAALDPLSAQGSWTYGTFAQSVLANPWPAAPFDTEFARDAAGITRQVTRYPGGERPPGTSRASWRLVDFDLDARPESRLYESRFMADVGGLVPDCKEAYANGASACIPFLVRYFRPMAQAGDRIYGVEELYQNTATFGQQPVVTRHVRPTWHERAPGGGVAAPPRVSRAKAFLPLR